MSDKRRFIAEVKSARSFLNLEIASGHSVVLTEVFGPGFDYVGFNETRWSAASLNNAHRIAPSRRRNRFTNCINLTNSSA